MHRCLLWLLATMPTSFPGGLDSPPQWSPDGRWLAYTISAPNESAGLPPGWLFGGVSARPEGSSVPSSVTFRMIVTELATGSSVLFEESRGPLSAPAWRPDGLGLAFGRVVRQGDGRARLEYLTQEGLQSQRVIASQALDPASSDLIELPRLAPSWSPEGRYLACPGPHGEGFSIVRADNGRTLKSVDGGVWPVWSPDGSRLAYVLPGRIASLQMLDAGFGPSRKVADLGQVYQPPCWTRDGRGVRVVVNRPDLRRFGPSSVVELVRVDAETGAREVLAPLSFDPVRGRRTPLALSYAIDRDGDNLFFAATAEGLPSSIVWFRPKTEETLKRVHPIDYSTWVGGLSLAPGGRHLAARFGPPGSSAPVGVWEASTDRFTPLVPDDPARRAWVALMIRTAGEILRMSVPPAMVSGKPIERPTILPIPGEIPKGREFDVRLRRLGRIGRPLCDRPNSSAATDPATEPLLRAGRLTFSYLLGDYPAALTALEAVEERTASGDDRLRLLSLRAQILLGLGEKDRAGDIVDYLRAAGARRPRRIEWTLSGYVLSDRPSGGSGWADYLGSRVRAAAEAGSTDEEPTETETPRFRLHSVPAPPVPRLVPFAPRDPNLIELPAGR